jgi:D-beta-D-heptose 7-phosphate kinase/D-beta-D-heptose 1-phosphate adenosyltransferase
MDIQLRKKFKILLVGDSCVDVYRYGTVDRISPEAPVPIFKLSHEEERPGMASNVLANLNALDCDVTFITGQNSIKTRLIDLRSKQHIVRIDQDITSESISSKSLPDLSGFDAILISDYDKGSVSYDLISFIRNKYTGPIFLDTKKRDLAQFWGIYVKVNEQEYNNRWSINDKLIVTLGSNGVVWKNFKDENRDVIFPAPKVEVVDVCGAGDTFTSSLVYAYLLSEGQMNSAIEFAIRSAAISVQHLGCYAPSLKEIQCV